MAALGMKLAGLLVVIHSLLLLQIHSSEALNLFGYPYPWACGGDAMGCVGHPPNVCCAFQNRTVSVRFDFLKKCQRGFVYGGKNCSKLITSINGPAPPNICLTYFPGIFSASYQNLNNKTCECPQRVPADEHEKSSETSGHGHSHTKCKLPNAITHTTPGSTDGTWVLEADSDKVPDLFAKLEKLPLDKKVIWLKSQGARLSAHESQQSDTVDGSHT